MSEENVEIVRQVYDAVARGEDAATLLGFYDPEVEWDLSRVPLGGFTGGVHHGHEGIRAFFREWHQAWETVEPHLQEVIDAGDQVVSVVITRGRGRTSGAEVELPHYSVWTIRQGKIVRQVWFETRAEALEAAGLSE